MWFVIIISITAPFFFRAKKHDLNKFKWTFIGFISFFIGIVLAAVILVLIDPDIPSKPITNHTLWVARIGGISNTILAWLLMSSKIKEGQ